MVLPDLLCAIETLRNFECKITVQQNVAQTFPKRSKRRGLTQLSFFNQWTVRGNRWSSAVVIRVVKWSAQLPMHSLGGVEIALFCQVFPCISSSFMVDNQLHHTLTDWKQPGIANQTANSLRLAQSYQRRANS